MLGQEEKQAIVDLFPFLSEKPVILDIGSNKGHFVDVVLEKYLDEGQIHLFEPNSKLLSFTEIKYEYKKNIWYNDIVVYKEDNKSIDFYYFENYNNELSSIHDRGKDWEGLPKKKTAKKTITIDTYCKQYSIDEIDYLKIDAEGADYDVLQGCKKLISDGKVKVGQFEYTPSWDKEGDSFKGILSLLNDSGYKVYKYSDSNFWEVTEIHPPAGNYFFSNLDIHNYTGVDTGWATAFVESTKELPKMDMVLEIGAYEGMTTKYICENMLTKQVNSRVIVVDPLMDVYVEGDMEHTYFKNQYQRFLRNTNGLPVELKRSKSQEVFPELAALRFDLCYIDGDHRSPMPYLDACWCFAVTRVGGFILFDDYLWRDDTKESIDAFLLEFGDALTILKKEYQVLIIKDREKYNSITESYYL